METKANIETMVDALVMIWAGLYLLWGVTNLSWLLGSVVSGRPPRGANFPELILGMIVGFGLAALFFLVLARDVPVGLPIGLGILEAWNAAALLGFFAPLAILTFHRNLSGVGEYWAVPVGLLLAIILLTRGLRETGWRDRADHFGASAE